MGERHNFNTIKFHRTRELRIVKDFNGSFHLPNRGKKSVHTTRLNCTPNTHSGAEEHHTLAAPLRGTHEPKKTPHLEHFAVQSLCPSIPCPFLQQRGTSTALLTLPAAAHPGLEQEKRAQADLRPRVTPPNSLNPVCRPRPAPLHPAGPHPAPLLTHPRRPVPLS